MAILPIIDLLIFSGWSAILVGAVLKAVHVTTVYRPTVLGLNPIDCLMIGCMFFLMSLTLVGRTWVKAQEPQLQANRRALATLDAYAVTQSASEEAEPGEVASARVERALGG